MKTLSIEPLISFLKTLHELQRVERVMHVPETDRYENDVEHSYTLAMCAWYLIEHFELPFDRDKAIRYALAHDVLEVYAGDTYIFGDAKQLASKKAREDAARMKLAEEYPGFDSFHDAMKTYEEGSDAEAVFVRALDKLMPLMTNYVQDGRTLKERTVAYAELMKQKRAAMAKSPEAMELLEQMIALIDKDRSVMFEDRVAD